MGYFGLLLGAFMVVLITRLWSVLVYLTWRPYIITKRFRKQGIRGPTYKFWSGSTKEIRSMKEATRDQVLDIHSHDFIPKVMPHYRKWMSKYGGIFLYWFGPQPRVCISDIELVKQVLSSKSGLYPKTPAAPNVLALLGNGLVLIEGSVWARHRRVVSPAFTIDKLKAMTKKVAEFAKPMLERWQDQVIQAEGQQKGLDVRSQFQELMADIISHTIFGSNYIEGKGVFEAQNELQMIVAASILNVNIPGYKYLPTKMNQHKWKVERKARDALMRIIQSRLDSKGSVNENDLLGLMLESSSSDSSRKQEEHSMSMEEIIDECKTFFFAGYETTSRLLTWTMFLLSTNQEWQERLREEVSRECGMAILDTDNLSKLKLVTMVLLETLRLYAPVVMIQRLAAKDMNLGNMVIPKDTILTIPIAMIHQSKEIWGADANDFNPLRFENGISKAAKHPNALLSFSIGPRSCIGQNLALLEAKMVIAMILQRFSFSLSSDYIHAPLDMFTLQPQYGLPVVLKPLHV